MHSKAQVLSVLVLLLLIAPAAAISAQSPPIITVSNIPTGGPLVLAVGESHTFEIHILGQDEFLIAQAVLDQYYPGRSVFAGGIVSAHRSTEATLELTITGKVATDELPDGIAPVAIVVGARYRGGYTYSERYDFGIMVQP